MADLKEVFPILQDDSTSAGASPIARVEGDASAAKNGLIAFSFKDSTGDVILPQLSAGGGVPVSVAADKLCLKSPAGELAAGSATIALVTGAEITLTVDKVYEHVSFVVSSRRDSLFQIIWLDDATPTILAEVIVGPGQFTVCESLPCMKFTAGSTGTQKLQLKAKNFEAQSSLRGTLMVEEYV